MAFFAGEGRDEMRRRYLEAWRKFSAQEALEPLERQLAAVIAEHPESPPPPPPPDPLQAEFTPEGGRENPFLHMGLHLAIREQVSTDRPAGIADIHRALAARAGGAHEAEHRMIEPLAETLWEAQRSGRAPDEIAYLERLRRL